MKHSLPIEVRAAMAAVVYGSTPFHGGDQNKHAAEVVGIVDRLALALNGDSTLERAEAARDTAIRERGEAQKEVGRLQGIIERQRAAFDEAAAAEQAA